MRSHPKASPGESISGFGHSRTVLASALLSLLLALIVGVSIAWAAAKVPKIDETFVTNVTATSADLGALINPRGADTAYHFEYIAKAAYEANEAEGKEGFAGASRKPTEAQGDTDIGSGEVDQAAAAHLSGLAPSTAYIFRVLATNSVAEAKEGPIAGPEHAFTTQEASPNLALPDNRGYEMVSPVDKNGGDIAHIGGIGGGGVVQAAPDGDAITYASAIAFGEAQAAAIGSQYLSARAADGWSAQNITIPTTNGQYPLANAGGPYKAFSTDLSVGLVSNGGTPIQSLPLPGSNAPLGFENYYLRDNVTGTFQGLLTNANNTASETGDTFHMAFAGATPDLSHAVITSRSALAPGAIDNGKDNLYEWIPRNGGQFEQVNVLPDGQPSSFEQTDAAHFSAISDDGSRVIWSGGNALYVRENLGQPQSPVIGGVCTVSTDACTLQADASQGGPDPSGLGSFFAGAADGSKVFFGDQLRLTPDATGGSGGGIKGDLYEFDVDTGQLTDLTPSGGHVLGVVGASADGSYLYFVANSVLAEGASPGNCINISSPPGATCNLYLYHEGATAFVATLSANDEGGGDEAFGIPYDWNLALVKATTRISADGKHMVFMSIQSLTGYDNTVANGNGCGRLERGPPLPAACAEVFAYDATANGGAGQLTCVSCNPSGARPSGASVIPAGTAFDPFHAIYQSRVFSANGNRVFFESADALAPQDSNGKRDVYEWEAQGEGSCQREGGCIGLISNGTSAKDSHFVDASANGSDVFFVISSSLLPQDPGSVDLYDARAGGGFPPPAPGPAPCEGDACHSPPSPPGDPTLSTSISGGSGDQAESSKKHHKKRHGHRKSKKHHKRAANHNRGGAK